MSHAVIYVRAECEVRCKSRAAGPHDMCRARDDVPSAQLSNNCVLAAITRYRKSTHGK